MFLSLMCKILTVVRDIMAGIDDLSTSNAIQEPSNQDIKTEEVDCTDVDNCIKNILSWEMCLLNLNSRTQELLEENKFLKCQVEMMKTNRNSDRSSISDLQETVKTLHEVLKKRVDQEEDLRRTQEDLTLSKDKLAQTESKLESEKKRFKEIHQMQQNKHATEMLKLKEELNEQRIQKEKETNEIVEGLNIGIAAESEKRKEMAKKHENDIVKMQMEYESKLALMQAQNSRLQSNSNNVNFGSNEVFRKKLQHIQEESSKEINRLKQEVTVLKLKLEPNTLNNENSSALPSAGRPGILKRRRYQR